MPARRARADTNRAHSYQSGQTLLAHGVGRVIGGLHMQLAALRGASDDDGRPGGRRPRPYALCFVEMQLPIHPLLVVAVDFTRAARTAFRPHHGSITILRVE